MPTHQLVEVIQKYREIGICDSGASQHAHRDLYRFADDAYLVLTEHTDPFEEFSRLVLGCARESKCSGFRMHVVFHWRALLQVAAWKEPLTWPDIYLMLKDAGVEPAEMQPFRDGNPEDLFPWLYYGKRLDVLRRICLRAKRKLDDILSLHDIRTLCHLVADDPQCIIASSL